MSDGFYAVVEMLSAIAAVALLWSRIRMWQITRRLERSLAESRARAANGEAEPDAAEKPPAGE